MNLQPRKLNVPEPNSAEEELNITEGVPAMKLHLQIYKLYCQMQV